MSDENGCRDIGNKFIPLSTQRQVASSITNQLHRSITARSAVDWGMHTSI